MTQFTLYDNPIPRARRAYPLVVILQSDVAETGPDRIVAPLVPRARIPGTAGRLTPHVQVGGADHVVLVPSLTAVRAADLRGARGDLAAHRDDLIAALDLLFLGI